MCRQNTLVCQGKKKKDVIADICIIGRCLTAPKDKQSNLIDQCLHSFFAEEIHSEEHVWELDSNEKLIECVKYLLSQDQEYKDCNKLLKAEIVSLKTELKSCIATINKFKTNSLISESPLLLNNHDENISDIECEATDDPDSQISDSESVISETHNPGVKSKKNVNLVWAAPSYSDVFVGNTHPDITKQNIKDHLYHNRNIKVSITDIEKLPMVSKCNAFKVSVPSDKLNHAISGWPQDIKAERYSLKKPFVYPAQKSNRSYHGSKVRKNKQGFRNQKPRNSFSSSYWNPPGQPNWYDEYSFRPNGWNTPNHSNGTDQFSFRPNGHFKFQV